MRTVKYLAEVAAWLVACAAAVIVGLAYIMWPLIVVLVVSYAVFLLWR